MGAPIKRDKKGRIVKGTGGRPTGAIGHLNRTVKETVLAVFQDIQADPKVNLRAFAKTYPRDFYQIASRLIPTEITGSVKQIIKVSISDE